MIESLIGLLIVIAIIGVIVWFITAYVPMPAPFRAGILAIAAIVVLLFVLRAFGLNPAF